jgi:hypothetical protein
VTYNANKANILFKPGQLRKVLAFLGKHWAISLIVLAFVGLGGVYSVTTPLFETPNEPWHYAYVKRLADGQGLPPLSKTEDPWEQGETRQPPLYYVLGALLTHGIDTGPADRIYERNPYAALNLPNGHANKNAVLHLGGESSPYQGVALAVHLLRWFAVLCSILTIILTYALVLEIIPKRRVVALGAALLVAFNPQFIFTSAGVNNHALSIMLLTLALYLSLRVCSGKLHPYRTPILLGVIIGLAALTELSGLLAVILVPCAYLAEMHRRRSRRWWPDLLRPVLIAMGVMLVVSAWWYGRNAVVYHDPLGIASTRAAFGTRTQPLALRDTLPILLQAADSYWGVFGWTNILADEIFYTTMRILLAVGSVGLLLLLARIYWGRKALRDYRWRPVLLLVLWILVTLVSLMRRIQLTAGFQGSQLFPAISGIAFFLCAGLIAWLPRRWAYILPSFASVIALAFAWSVPSRYIAPAYAQPIRVPLEQAPVNMQDLDINFGDDLFLLGYDLREDAVQVGQALHLRLYWIAKKAMPNDYTFFVHVFGRQDQRIGGVDSYPGGGNYPTRLWLPGEIVYDDYIIPIARDTVAPTAAVLRVGVYARPSTQGIVATDAQGREVGSLPEIARIAVAPTNPPHYKPQQELQVNFDQKAMLTGYDLSSKTATSDRPWEITLYWKPLVKMSRDYTVFIHVLNPAGERVAQLDEQPLQGDYPTHLWQMEEKIQDVHRLSLPDNLATGEYQLRIGLYWLETGERLPVNDANPPTTYITLGPVQIQGK